MRAADEFDDVLMRLEQAVAETRSMVRTIRLAPIAPEHWPPAFRERGWGSRTRAGRHLRVRPRRLQHAAADVDAYAAALDLDGASGRLLAGRRRAADEPAQLFAALDPVADAQPLTIAAAAHEQPALSVSGSG